MISYLFSFHSNIYLKHIFDIYNSEFINHDKRIYNKTELETSNISSSAVPPKCIWTFFCLLCMLVFLLLNVVWCFGCLLLVGCLELFYCFAKPVIPFVYDLCFSAKVLAYWITILVYLITIVKAVMLKFWLCSINNIVRNTTCVMTDMPSLNFMCDFDILWRLLGNFAPY